MNSLNPLPNLYAAHILIMIGNWDETRIQMQMQVTTKTYNAATHSRGDTSKLIAE